MYAIVKDGHLLGWQETWLAAVAVASEKGAAVTDERNIGHFLDGPFAVLFEGDNQ